MELYTITLNAGETIQGCVKFDYAGHDVYGKETHEDSGIFNIEEIYFPEEVIEATKE